MGGKYKKIPAGKGEKKIHYGMLTALKQPLPGNGSHAIMKQNGTTKCFCAQRRKIWTSN